MSRRTSHLSELECGHERAISGDQALGVRSGVVGHSVYCQPCGALVRVRRVLPE